MKNSDNLSPLEVLQRQKSHLQERSNALTGSLEEDFEYLRRNVVFLLGESAISAVASKMPPFAQGLLLKGRSAKKNSGVSEKSKITATLKLLTKGAFNILPFFLKGKRGFITAFLLKQVEKVIF